MDNDRALKDVAMKSAGEHARKLLDRREFVDLCKIKGDIAVDVLKASLLNRGKLNGKLCPWHYRESCVQERTGDWRLAYTCSTNGSSFN